MKAIPLKDLEAKKLETLGLVKMTIIDANRLMEFYLKKQIIIQNDFLKKSEAINEELEALTFKDPSEERDKAGMELRGRYILSRNTAKKERDAIAEKVIMLAKTIEDMFTAAVSVANTSLGIRG